MNFRDLRIATRLWLAIGALIASLVILIGFAAVRAGQTQARADKLLGEADHKIGIATRWVNLTEAAVQRAIINAVAADPAVSEKLDSANKAAIAKITELQKELADTTQGDAEKAQMQKIADARKAVLDYSAKITALKAAGDVAGARALAGGPFTAATVPYLEALQGFVKLHEAAGRSAREQVAQDRQFTLVVAAIVVGFIVVLALVATALLVRSIRQPLREAIALAGRIAKGDLTVQQRAARRDEFGELMDALEQMRAALSSTVGQVRHAADSISSASNEIAAGSHDLSSRTEQAASSLQEAAASVQQLTGNVRHSAGSAQKANELATSAAQLAGLGGDVVSQVVATMSEIHTASNRIADIIGVIDGIAFQTNILALNASVEAARAGEQGRGFAVVASEVRNLAGRSAEASREIKALIEASVHKVEGGSKLVGDAGRTMGEIVASVKNVSQMISDITVAATEQSDGIGQVNTSVTQLDQMTQQNAALVEQSTAAAESLKDQAARLAQVVGGFQLDARVA